mmetsp:Transcript_25213/g.4170  ORF Transcript_25213/g.4170 Transcript_25213/m.4170 type:complete len:83 (-) Transcript_25213:419-667(-)
MYGDRNVGTSDFLRLTSLMIVNDDIVERHFLEFDAMTSTAITFVDEENGYKHIWPDGTTNIPLPFISFDHDCYYEESVITEA